MEETMTLNVEDFKLTLKAIELISKGVDVTDKDYEYLKGYVTTKGNYVTRLTPNVTDFRCVIDDSVKELAGMPYNKVYRTGNEYKLEYRDDVEYVPDIDISYDIFVETIRVLHKAGISKFVGVDDDVLDPTIAERLRAIDESFNRKVIPDCAFVKEMTIDATRKWFTTATAAVYMDEKDVARKMYEAYNIPLTKFNLKGFEDYPIVDNRLYIPLSEADRYRIKKFTKDSGRVYDVPEDIKYIVISKNLYDYYFCSYGSAFQSCYSLTSDHKGCYGMLPLGIFDGHYMIYATKDEPQKTSVDGTGTKWKTPYMLWRCWGWAAESDNTLLIDKLYTSSDTISAAMIRFLETLGASTSYRGLVKDSEEFSSFFNEYDLRFYSDSIELDGDEWIFDRGDGDREFVGSCFGRYSSMKRQLEIINKVSDSFDINKPYEILSGLLANFKTCPITQLKIDETTDKSPLAKLFTSPVSSTLVLTYCDGFVKCDEHSIPACSGSLKVDGNNYGFEITPTCIYLSKRFAESGKDIKVFKELMKQHIHGSIYDVAVVRFIEGDKVTYVKYKKKGTN